MQLWLISQLMKHFITFVKNYRNLTFWRARGPNLVARFRKQPARSWCRTGLTRKCGCCRQGLNTKNLSYCLIIIVTTFFREGGGGNVQCFPTSVPCFLVKVKRQCVWQRESKEHFWALVIVRSHEMVRLGPQSLMLHCPSTSLKSCVTSVTFFTSLFLRFLICIAGINNSS